MIPCVQRSIARGFGWVHRLQLLIVRPKVVELCPQNQLAFLDLLQLFRLACIHGVIRGKRLNRRQGSFSVVRNIFHWVVLHLHGRGICCWGRSAGSPILGSEKGLQCLTPCLGSTLHVRLCQPRLFEHCNFLEVSVLPHRLFYLFLSHTVLPHP